MAIVRLLRANLVAFRSPSALQDNEALPQLLDVLQKLVISPFGAEVTPTGKVNFCPSLCYIFHFTVCVELKSFLTWPWFSELNRRTRCRQKNSCVSRRPRRFVTDLMSSTRTTSPGQHSCFGHLTWSFAQHLLSLLSQARAAPATSRPRGLRHAPDGQGSADRALVLQRLRHLAYDTCHP